MDVIEWFFCFGREDESFSMEGWDGDGDLEEELFKGQLEIFCGFKSEIERRFWYFHECNAEISKDFFRFERNFKPIVGKKSFPIIYTWFEMR